MTWQIYTLISVLGLSSSVLLQRVLVHKDKVDPVAYAVFFQGLVALLLLIYAAFSGYNFSGFSKNLALPAIASLFLYGIGHVIYAKTLQKVEASAFSVLFSTHAVWVMILGIILLGESLSPLQILGAVLIFISVLLLVKNMSSFKIDKGTSLGLITGLIFGLAVTCWAYVGRYVDPVTWAAISFAGASAVAALQSPNTLYKIKPMLKSNLLLKMVLLALFYGGGSLAMLYAYKLGTFSEVSPLRQTGIIVTVILAFIFLPIERNRVVRKIIAASLATLGVILIIL